MDLSVIIPIYKGLEYLEYWIGIIEKNRDFLRESNEQYTYEVLLVNDYPDERVSLEPSLVEKLNIKIYNLPTNKGIHGARVFGYNHASGEYILFLDQDDKIAENYFVSQLTHVQDYDAVVCNGYRQRFCMSGKRRIFGTEEQQRAVMQMDTFTRNWNVISSPGQVLIRKSAIPQMWISNILKTNGVDDYFLWILMHKGGKKFGINPEFLYTHIGHGDNTSTNSTGMKDSIDEMLLILETNNILCEEESNALRMKNEDIYGKQKFMGMVILYDYWMYLKINNKGTAEYFEKNGYQKIAIYGMNYIGSRLYDELVESPIEVLFGIDQNAKKIVHEIPVLELEEAKDMLKNVDVVVVTAISAFEEIKKAIEKECDTPVVSMKDVLIEACIL